MSENTRTIKNILEARLFRMLTPPEDQANEQLACSSNASLCSGAARKAPANDPDVQGTGLPGFAQLRARAMHQRDECHRYALEYEAKGNEGREREWESASWAFNCVLQWLDAIEADAKDACTQE
jgi:hypothetical protein